MSGRLLLCLLLAACSVPSARSVDRRSGDLVGHLRSLAARAPVAVAHRGDSEAWPENTLVAFRSAVRVGAPVVEFDVRQTSDGVWVCMHDETLDRTTDARAVLGRSGARVDATTADDLARLDAGRWRGPQFAGEPVPTLAAALAALGDDAIAMVERKAGSAAALVAELRRLGAAERVIVQAFDWPWLEEVHALEPRLCLAALGDQAPSADLMEQVRRTGARIVHWNHRTIALEDCQRLRQAGLLLCVYTVNPDAVMLGAAAVGCDLITTDRPARLLELAAAGWLRR